MKMFYTIDCGNSQIKIHQFDKEGNILSRQFPPSLSEVLLDEDSHSILCTVTNENSIKHKNLVHLSELKSNLAFNTKYSSTLGDDRLAISFYIQKTRNSKIAIIDAGSFITIDYIEDGVHIGGHIYPGVSSFLHSYSMGSQLPDLPYSDENSLTPINTESAILSATNIYLKSIRNSIATDYKVIITGGDAKKLCQRNDEVDEYLMPKSLFYILKKVLL